MRVLLIFLFCFLGSAALSYAQTPGFLNPSVTSSIPEFIKGFYDFALIVAGVLAVGAIVVGGIMYSVSGAVDKKNEAKGIILGAIFGLLLLLGSYVILRAVNPELVSLDAPELPEAGFSQCTEEAFKEGKLGNIEKCKYEKGDYWPIDFKTGECRCYIDKEWVKEYNIRMQETENINGPDYNQGNGPPPSQTGCCVSMDSKITVKNNRQVDRGVNELLVRLHNVQGLKSWRVTEACPPTHPHQASCHKQGNCTCVDVGINPPGSGTCNDWEKLKSAAKSVGFNVLDEVVSCKGVKTKYGSGDHLHLEMPK